MRVKVGFARRLWQWCAAALATWGNVEFTRRELLCRVVAQIRGWIEIW
jgi:hypothetical protein